jgi:hypothetical protein
MADYKPYGNKKTVPSRLTRKQDRRRIWTANRKANRLLKESRRQQQYQESE